ncbi:Zn-dependent protease with chaperone function [Amycolatopsis arida]|uniref:Zn-dependent protease with chaperone function n=1 Tax=Amycolatopsis arida TaxID=587909 RepID=A0A1I6ALU2_9PSEU|nr:M56 family metallopeptidase [Amycolatopsis arida]TDX87390.1 Zn-dependent protease with chaperone function [Amycolatopsis arida]SFQ69681.1 Zn-dependent protease with chaperone function [Amycolatopsis arida]
MIVASLLFGYAALALVAGPVLLRRAGWLSRAPRLGIAAWLAWSGSLLLAVLLGALVLAVPTALVSRGLGELLRACAMALRAWYATPGGAVLATAGVLVAVAVLARLGYSAATVLGGVRRERRRHHDALALVGRPHPETGSTLVEHDQPAAYCVPGRPHRVVLTTAALRTLDAAQLAGVLAHERAHLRGRHHLVLGAVSAVEHAFPLPPLRTAAREVGRLVEMLADDHAGRHADRLDLAEALLALAGSPVPAAGLGASGSAASARVRRLLTPYRPLGRARGVLAGALTALAIALPATIAGQPALAAQHLPYCPPGESAPAAPGCAAAVGRGVLGSVDCPS